MEEYQICTLSNGLRLIHRPTQSAVSYCGFTVNAGTRDEEEAYNGLAHFVEHTLFKGTTHRRASHILNRMEVVGGELNAYTAKEETVVYSIFQFVVFGAIVKAFPGLFGWRTNKKKKASAKA